MKTETWIDQRLQENQFNHQNLNFSLLFPENFYGTPKPPAEPSALLLNVTDQLLPGARPSSEGKRKRNKSVSNMERAGVEPPEEEEEEEKPVVNGNGVAVTPGQSPTTSAEAEVDSALSRRSRFAAQSRSDGFLGGGCLATGAVTDILQLSLFKGGKK